MSFRKKLPMALASVLLLSLVSCGNKGKSSHKRAAKTQNPICEDVSCLSTVNWKIQLPGRHFPEKVRVDINGTTILNECVAKQKYMIDRDAEPQNLYLENYVIPKRGDLKIHVMDLGHCESSFTFVENNDVDFDFVKRGLDREIVINL